MNIGQSQSNYLKTIHLDEIGETKGSSAPIEMDAVTQSLVDLAILFAKLAAEGLEVAHAIDTALLAESIQFDKVKFQGGLYSIDINVLEYYKFVNSGVSGTINKINSPFSFKNDRVSSAMVLAIKGWITRHGLKARVKEVSGKNKKYRLGTEKKKLDFKKQNIDSVSWAVAKSIKKKGLKATHFWDKAVKGVEEQMEKTIGNAFAISIVNEIARKK